MKTISKSEQKRSNKVIKENSIIFAVACDYAISDCFYDFIYGEIGFAFTRQMRLNDNTQKIDQICKISLATKGPTYINIFDTQLPPSFQITNNQQRKQKHIS
jgi:hypothetical protein